MLRQKIFSMAGFASVLAAGVFTAACSSPAANVVEDPDMRVKDIDTVRNSIINFEQKVRENGAVKFDVSAPNEGNFVISYVLYPDGDYSQAWVNPETDKKQESRFLGDRIYTLVSAVSSEVQEWIELIDPDAKWFSEPTTAEFAPVSPSRTLESLLAYATQVVCAPIGEGESVLNPPSNSTVSPSVKEPSTTTPGGKENTVECIIISKGLNNIIGVGGGFDIPENGIDTSVTIVDGILYSMIIFVNNPELERVVNSFVFGPVTITNPTEEEIISLEAIRDYIAEVTPEGEEPDPKKAAAAQESASKEETQPSDTGEEFNNDLKEEELTLEEVPMPNNTSEE